MTQSLRPANKKIIDSNTGRLSLEWDAYFARLEQLLANTLTGSVISFEGRNGIVVSTSGDYNAGEITNTPAGNISSVTVQAAINELDTEKQPVDATLTALAAYNTNGLIAQTAADTFAGRTLTAPVAGITITDGNGVAGNPTLVLANDLAALEGLGSTGLAARTGSDAWAQRTITGTANEITVSNGDGVSGNPTLSLPAEIDLGGKTSLEIPNSAAPTVNTDGEIALDTSVTDFSHGIVKYYGGEELGIVAMPIAQFSSPADGNIVTYNATNDEFVLASPGATGGLVEAVASGSISSAATLDIALGSADMYEIEFLQMAPATDAVNPHLRFSQSSSFLSGASDYAWQTFRRAGTGSGTSFVEEDTADTEIQLSGSVGNAAGEYFTGKLRLWRPSVASFYKEILCEFAYFDSSGSFRIGATHGRLIANTNAIDGVRFLFSSGDIASGYYAVRSYSFT